MPHKLPKQHHNAINPGGDSTKNLRKQLEKTSLKMRGLLREKDVDEVEKLEIRTKGNQKARKVVRDFVNLTILNGVKHKDNSKKPDPREYLSLYKDTYKRFLQEGPEAIQKDIDTLMESKQLKLSHKDLKHLDSIASKGISGYLKKNGLDTNDKGDELKKVRNQLRKEVRHADENKDLAKNYKGAKKNARRAAAHKIDPVRSEKKWVAKYAKKLSDELNKSHGRSR